jgi:tripeptidyl-peptidase-1
MANTLLHVLLLGAVAAVALAASRVELEPDWQVDLVPAGWTNVDEPAHADAVRVTIVLKEENVPELLTLVDKTSDPHSPTYGQHLSIEELQKLVYVHPSHRAAVRTWLLNENASIINDDPLVGFIVAEFMLADLERAFAVKMVPFVHTSGQRFLRSSSKYTVPATIADAIDLVDGFTRFPNRNSKILPTAQKQHGNFNITPAVIKEMYHVTEPPRTGKNLQSIVSFLKQYYVPEDLAQFQKQNGLKDQPVAKTIGENDASAPGVEAQVTTESFLSADQSLQF